MLQGVLECFGDVLYLGLSSLGATETLHVNNFGSGPYQGSSNEGYQLRLLASVEVPNHDWR